MVKIIPTEYQECKAFWEWAQHMPLLREYLIKIVNEGKRSVIAGRRLKAIGIRAGVPDYFLPVPTPKYNGLWLEMKRKTRYSVSGEQTEWLAKLNKQRYYASVAYGFDHAREITENYLACVL